MPGAARWERWAGAGSGAGGSASRAGARSSAVTARVGTYAWAALGSRPSIASISIRSASPAEGRSAGSLRSSAVMTGPRGPDWRGTGGSSLTTAWRLEIGEVRRNGERASTAVYRVAPSDHRSEDGSGAPPVTRSGAR